MRNNNTEPGSCEARVPQSAHAYGCSGPPANLIFTATSESIIGAALYLKY